MHKKLKTELFSLANEILKMKNFEEVAHLQEKARGLYEKLTVISVVDNYLLTPQISDTPKTEPVSEKQAIIAEEKTPVSAIETPVKVEKPVVDNSKKEEEDAQLIAQTMDTIKEEATGIVNKIQVEKPVAKAKEVPATEVKEIPIVKTPFTEEMKDAIPADVAANMFKKASDLEDKLTPKTPITPKATPIQSIKSTSINDSIHKQKLQIGLNDRIAFVKHLFNFSQEDFNRVLSQLNSFGTEQECKDFVNNSVKPEYNWTDKLEYEERLIELIERKFK